MAALDAPLDQNVAQVVDQLVVAEPLGGHGAYHGVAHLAGGHVPRDRHVVQAV